MSGSMANNERHSDDYSSYQMKSSRYLLLRLKIIFMLIRKRKLTVKKVINLVICYLSYYAKRARSAKFPFAISFELSNECNANCIFCRTAQGEIHNQNPHDATFIEKGFISYDLYAEVIDEAKEYLLMAILYVNGEPLIYKQLYEAVRQASRNNVASMIATNGILLTEENIRKLLKADIDFIKIAISGFSQETYSRQVRRGGIETVKLNLQRLSDEVVRHGSRTIVMVDFMQYEYNLHEIVPAKEFCDELGFMFNVRKGNTAHLHDAEDPEKVQMNAASEVVCDWPWKVLTINWNGDLFPCCDYVVWTKLPKYTRIRAGAVNIEEVWNGEAAMQNRKAHATTGRKSIPVCSHCNRNSITFKY